MTHSDKDKLIDELKKQLLAAKELIIRKKDLDMNDLGFSIIKKDGVFYLVQIKFNAENKSAEVETMLKIGSEYSLALYHAKKFLVETIFAKI